MWSMRRRSLAAVQTLQSLAFKLAELHPIGVAENRVRPKWSCCKYPSWLYAYIYMCDVYMYTCINTQTTEIYTWWLLYFQTNPIWDLIYFYGPKLVDFPKEWRMVTKAKSCRESLGWNAGADPPMAKALCWKFPLPVDYCITIFAINVAMSIIATWESMSNFRTQISFLLGQLGSKQQSATTSFQRLRFAAKAASIVEVAMAVEKWHPLYRGEARWSLLFCVSEVGRSQVRDIY